MLWHDANVVASSPWQLSSPSSSAVSGIRSQWPLSLRLSCATVVLIVMTHSLASPSAVGWVQALTAATPTTARIQVCQNKDCRQRWSLQTPLPEVVHDLLSAGNGASTAHVRFRVESTGCLSQCGQGPNVCVINARGSGDGGAGAAAGTAGSEVYLNGLSTPIAVVSQLEDAFSTSIPSKLLAAVTVLERAQNAVSLEEQERFASSILQALQTEPALLESTIFARARILRANVYRETNRAALALEEMQQVICDLTRQESRAVESGDNVYRLLQARAHRVVADVYLDQQNYEQAAEALRSVMICNPTLQSKVILELERLSQKR